MVLGHSTVEPACEDLDFRAFVVFSFSSIEALSACPFVQPIKSFFCFVFFNFDLAYCICVWVQDEENVTARLLGCIICK